MWLRVLTKNDTRTVDDERAKYNINLKDPEKERRFPFFAFCLNSSKISPVIQQNSSLHSCFSKEYR